MSLMTAKQINEISDPIHRGFVREEQTIVRRLVRSALSKGYSVSVNDGEETTLKRSTKPSAIYEALRTTDEDVLIVHGQDGKRLGWFLLIWGEGDCAIADHSANDTCENLWNELGIT